MPTRTGNHVWDRSVIWAMLRNPAYAGTAMFGKTLSIDAAAGINRAARIAGQSTPTAHQTIDRPRQEWTAIPVPAIPVPAIITELSFARTEQRLIDNKQFGARNSKIPSLLQGLTACAGCGYAYYRYPGGRVCTNTPVRADYLDQVIWDHLTALISEPALITTEIDKRRRTALTADPTIAERRRLHSALTKTTTTIARMITAFSEQLLTNDELRTRMPDLRARETNLTNQIQALDAQTADRGAYLKLADDLHGLLSQLRQAANSTTTPERQRVPRLLIKDTLIGPESITIPHHIPIRERTPTQTEDPDTEGDRTSSYPLRWGRDDAALGCAGSRVPDLSVRGHHTRGQERSPSRLICRSISPIRRAPGSGRRMRTPTD